MPISLKGAKIPQKQAPTELAMPGGLEVFFHEGVSYLRLPRKLNSKSPRVHLAHSPAEAAELMGQLYAQGQRCVFTAKTHETCTLVHGLLSPVVKPKAQHLKMGADGYQKAARVLLMPI